MLRNIFVVLGMVFCFCVSCDKEDNDVKAVENMRDWYKVEDKPGEVNHLLYKMYKYYDVTIFINDTLDRKNEVWMLTGNLSFTRNCLIWGITCTGLTRMGE
ncbi:MAG: hypothetical protein ACLU4J_12620 [Butyricimonas paravirosa]